MEGSDHILRRRGGRKDGRKDGRMGEGIDRWREGRWKKGWID